MSTSVLVTGGAGFIGCALTRRLVKAGYDVAVMDVLHPQVHGGGRAIDLPPSVRLFTGDVTHAPDWDAVLRLFRPSQIIHLAAETGTAQSLSHATRHGSVNVVGTTQLLDALSRVGTRARPARPGVVKGRLRRGRLALRHTNLLPAPSQPCTATGWHLGSQGAHGRTRSAASELRRPDRAPANQHLRRDKTRTGAHADGLGSRARHPSQCLRLQNVYGPGQSLTNSYTGIVTLFARLAREQRPLEVYEDGRIVRDFVFIDDVVDAVFAAVQTPATEPRCLDIGSGIATTIHELARKIAAICDAPEPIVVPKFRDGDVRAASCAIEPAKNKLRWRPKWELRGRSACTARMDRRTARIACLIRRSHSRASRALVSQHAAGEPALPGDRRSAATLSAGLVIRVAISRARATYCGARMVRRSATSDFWVVAEKRRAVPTFSRLTRAPQIV